MPIFSKTMSFSLNAISVPQLHIPNKEMDVVYPIITTKLNNSGPYNIGLDTFAGSNYICQETFQKLNCPKIKRSYPIVVNSFGNNYSDDITEYTNITFENGISVRCNIVPSICDLSLIHI